MSNKSFSIYNSKEEDIADIDDRLIVEVGKNHIACLRKKEHKRTVSAFELFNFTDREAADFPKLLTAISLQSKLFNKSFPAVQVFINHELSLLVPVFKFNAEIAEDYLDIVFGEDQFSKIQYEHLPVEPGMMNVYRVSEELLRNLNRNFTNLTLRHTYSNIVKTIVSDIYSFPPDCVYVQFYNTFIIVAVIRNEKLQIIQSFIYEAPEDVLYNLLNLVRQFNLNIDTITLQISGMIDLHYTLYRDLITYFRHVEVHNVHSSSLDIDIKEFPLHYFTPFFNLAL
jgi:hypothetical protein